MACSAILHGMTPPLLIYFSRSGNTRRLADMIADGLTFTREEIRDLIPHKGFFGYFRSGYEAIFHKPCQIGASLNDPSVAHVVVSEADLSSGHVRMQAHEFLHSLHAATNSNTTG